MTECLDTKDFQKANKITIKINSMNGTMNNYFEFEYVYNIASAIRQEAKDILSDIENQNNLKNIRERLAHLKGISSN